MEATVSKPQYSIFKTTAGGISFEKPQIDAATLKPIFKENIFCGGLNLDIEQARVFANNLLQVCREVESIKTSFECFKNDENALLKIVAEYEHQ